MFSTCIASSLALAVLAGIRPYAIDDPVKKDPPRQLEGIVRIIESGMDNGFLTISVKEKQPTDMEDILVDVEKDHMFRITARTRILGMDGKRASQGLPAIEVGNRVRVEYFEDRVLEVKIVARESDGPR
jgi:hypothetical protein